MKFLIFSVPFLTALFLLLKFRRETVWWEYILLIVPSMLISIFIEFCMVQYEVTSTEYLGAYATKITHYDDWDEWVHKICTRKIRVGTNSDGSTKYRTETYDCSYRKYHADEWFITDNSDKHLYINQSEFNRIRDMWKTPSIFQDMNRRYYTKDGDAQYHLWDNNKETTRTITYSHSYDNKVKVSKSVFNFENIDKKEADRLGLFNYPELNNYDQNPILGYKRVNLKDVNSIKYVNGMLGKSKQFRTFLLCFYNKDVSISMKQQSYWVGGNKNEFVICVGLDSLTNKIQWVNAFSWMDEPKLEVNIEQYLREKEYLDIPELSDTLMKRVPNEWKRKEFEDFNYLNIELSRTQYIWILVLTLLYNIGISIYVICNEYKNN